VGWKNVKEHYRIEHIVHVREGAILIGSGYVPDLLKVDPDGTVSKPHKHLGDSEQLLRYRNDMESDRAKLGELIETPDSFGDAIVVYTWNEDQIIEKKCEAIGWPNVTFDGELMYDNRFSTSRDEVIGWARENASYVVASFREGVEERERDLARSRERLVHWSGVSERLEATV
jgi:hypothetical protein